MNSDDDRAKLHHALNEIEALKRRLDAISGPKQLPPLTVPFPPVARLAPVGTGTDLSRCALLVPGVGALELSFIVSTSVRGGRQGGMVATLAEFVGFSIPIAALGYVSGWLLHHLTSCRFGRRYALLVGTIIWTLFFAMGAVAERH